MIKFSISGLFFTLCLFIQSQVVLAQTADELINRARAAIEKKDYQNALADLDQALRIEKKNAEAYALRGDANLGLKKVESARLDYNRAIKISSKTSLFYSKRALSYRESPGEDRNAALADFNRAIELDPNNEDALRERGFTYYAADNYDAAIADFNLALKINARDAAVYGYLARIHLKKDLDAALADYAKYIEIKPDDPYIYVERARIYEALEKYDLALADYSKIVELLPNDLIGYGNRGDIYLKQNKLELALADYTREIELKPNDSSGYTERGVVYEKQGKDDLAIQDFQKALQLFSYYTTAKEHLASLLAKRQQNNSPSAKDSAATAAPDAERGNLLARRINSSIEYFYNYIKSNYHQEITDEATRHINCAVIYTAGEKYNTAVDAYDELKKMIYNNRTPYAQELEFLSIAKEKLEAVGEAYDRGIKLNGCKSDK